jgi:hypothetical protein
MEAKRLAGNLLEPAAIAELARRRCPNSLADIDAVDPVSPKEYGEKSLEDSKRLGAIIRERGITPGN